MACCLDQRNQKVKTLRFLAEIEERRIHLLAAASSMWDYARRFLRMSHGTAYRHIVGARLCRRFPFLLERIAQGELHLTTLAQIASFLTPENVRELVDETKGKSRTDVDLVLRKWFGVERRDTSPFPYDVELLKMVERARELLSHTIPNGDRLAISKLAYAVLIHYLEKGKRAKAERPGPAPTEPTKSVSRHATRAMFEEHGDQCGYVDERTGERCPSRAFIQKDHRHMQVHGGTHDPTNLRPMCAAHNLFLAELVLGRDYVQSRIRCRQQKQNDESEPPGS
jgi:hypothetical protein